MFEKQVAAFEKFKELKVGALFMKMGTGKTKVAIDLVNYNQVDFLLYFAPFSTLSNIQIEIEKWGVNCPYRLVGFESLSSSDRLYMDLLEQVQGKKVFVIADESIFIKNPETNRYKRLMKIRKQCDYALILNGTPITKNEWDLYYQFEFLSPLIFKMSEGEFRSVFYDKVTFKRRYQQPRTFYKLSEVNSGALQKIIAPYTFQADLDFQLKESEEVIRCSVDLTDYQQEKISSLDDMQEAMSLSQIMALLNRLNHLSAIQQAKNDRIVQHIKGRPVIVYCAFLDEVDYLSSQCACYVITGSTNMPDRAAILEKFRQDQLPLIMTFGVGSYSLNLQFCNEIVFSSLSFDYGKIEQAKYRIKRIGQERDIRYYYFLSECGINEMILKNLDQKRNLSDLIKEKIERDEYEWLKTI